MSEFDKFLDAHLASIEGRYTAPEEAGRFYSWMRDNHPEVLDAWLLEQALHAISMEIARRGRSKRARARHWAKPRAFAEAAASHEAGDSESLEEFVSIYDVEHVVDDGNTRARAKDMTGAEHRFVAAGYRASEKRSAMFCAFHEAVAKKVGRRKTFEVLSREQYESMYQSITGKAA